MDVTRALAGVWAVWATCFLQIPERAEWEITFAQVEAAAGLPDLRRSPPDTFEARVMNRAATAMAPMPFLRIVRTDGTVHAQAYVFWGGNVSPSARPQGADVRCRDGVCVKPIALEEQRDWRAVLESLAGQDACPAQNAPKVVTTPDGGATSVIGVCPHCPMVWIKTAVEGKYREQVCSDPLPESAVGALSALMFASAEAARR